MSSRPGSPYGSRPSGGGRSHSTSRPLGVSIICVLGFIGFFVAFVPILALLGLGGVGVVFALLFAVLNVANLYVLVGLWNMRAWALPWALVFQVFGLLVDIFTESLLGMIVSLLIIGYLVTITEKFNR